VAYGGLEPLVRLAERCGLPSLIAERVRMPVTADGVGAFPPAKVAGMAAGADSIAHMDRCGTARWTASSAGSARFGFRTADAVIALVMLCLGGNRPVLPRRQPG
jgi:hypothetical protein